MPRFTADTDLAIPRLMEALGVFHDQHDCYEEAYTLRWIAIAQRALPILRDLGDDLPASESFAAEDASTRR